MNHAHNLTPITWELINPPADKEAPLTKLFGQILVAVHGGQDKVSQELMAAMHLLRTIELATQQFGALSYALIQDDPGLAYLHDRILAPVVALSQDMLKAFTDPAPAPAGTSQN
jgi:hypothetical protein